MIDKPLTPIAAMHDLDRNGDAYVVTIEFARPDLKPYDQADVYAHSADWILVSRKEETTRTWVNTAHILSIRIDEL